VTLETKEVQFSDAAYSLSLSLRVLHYLDNLN